MTLTTVVNAYGVSFLSSFPQQLQKDKNKSEIVTPNSTVQLKYLIQWGISLGISWGILAGIRMPGIFVSLFFFLTYFLINYKRQKPWISIITLGFPEKL